MRRCAGGRPGHHPIEHRRRHRRPTPIVIVTYIFINVRQARGETGSEMERRPTGGAPSRRDARGHGARPRLPRPRPIGLIAVGLPLDWLNEPARQAGTREAFDPVVADVAPRCSPPPRTAASTAPAATVAWRPSAARPLHDHRRQRRVRGQRQLAGAGPQHRAPPLRRGGGPDILVYGRPFSPMPAWGVEGGGPLNDQQIDNLIAYLESIQITPEEAQAQAEAGLALARTAASSPARARPCSTSASTTASPAAPTRVVAATPRAGPTASRRPTAPGPSART